MRKIIFLVLFVTLFLNTVIASDSLKVVHLENKIELLNYKIDTLEDSTDRLLNGLYFTIGLILASVIGLNIWNWIVQNRRHSNLIKEEIAKSQKELTNKYEEIKDRIQSSITKSFDTNTIHIFKEIIELKLELIDHKSKFIDYSNTESEFDLIKKYLQLAMDYYEIAGYGDYKVQKALVSLQDYIQNDNFVYHTDMDRLIKELSSDKYKNFSNYTDKIVKILKEK